MCCMFVYVFVRLRRDECAMIYSWGWVNGVFINEMMGENALNFILFL
jgi:hypothetical protein